MHVSTVEMSHIKQLNAKRSKMRFKEEMLSTRRSYVTTALAKIAEKLTEEANEQVNTAREHVNTAKENIIRQFAKIETKKRNKKQVTKVQENNRCS